MAALALAVASLGENYILGRCQFVYCWMLIFAVVPKIPRDFEQIVSPLWEGTAGFSLFSSNEAKDSNEIAE